MSRHKHPHHSSQTQRNTAKGTTPGAIAGQGGAQSIVERMRLRAYEISIARNGGPGDELSDRVQAEHAVNGATEARPVNDEVLCDSTTLEIKTRSQPTLATARGGL